ncbi:unnamed protein product [marine sediment metagenome]|uniref:Uncharacterized protein n=1 Tax=marine sediment metagenome TaxID=412755 RepID=X1LQ50_9ZZZZ
MPNGRITKAEMLVVNKVEVNIVAVADLVTMPIDIVACNVTMPISLTGSEIQMPVDLQGSFIMMPMDIQAQYMDLAIDVVAQSIGNIKMDICAQTIGNIGIDLAAQSVGNVAISIAGQVENVYIDLKAQTIAMKSQGEWSPQQGQQKFVSGSETNVASLGVLNVDSSVPGGKTRYITHYGFFIVPYNVADADKMHIGQSSLRLYSPDTAMAWLGGNGGNQISFPTPVKFTQNQVVRMVVQNMTGHACSIGACWGGYDI